MQYSSTRNCLHEYTCWSNIQLGPDLTYPGVFDPSVHYEND